jgi:hypothetical protein
LAVLSLCLCNQSLANEPVKIKTAWKTTLSYNNWMDTEPAVMKIQDGYLVAGVSNHKTDSDIYESKNILWKTNLQGKQLLVKVISIPAWETGKPFVAERCFAIEDEPTLLLVSASTLRAWLLRFDNSGAVVFSKGFSAQQVFDVQGFKKTSGGFLLYGSEHKGQGNSDACVTKITRDGNEIWRREYDKGKMEWGMGLAPQKDGGFILSADSGSYNKFGGGPSEAWIVKCDPNGNILSETIFDGRHPSVTINGDVTAVVFNKENFPQQDMAVVGLDGELKTLWRIDSLFGKADGLGVLATIVNKQGNFVLAGGKFQAAGLWEISKEGKILKEFEIEGVEGCVKVELMQTSAGYLVAGGAANIPKRPLTAEDKAAKGTYWDNMDILVAEVADPIK